MKRFIVWGVLLAVVGALGVFDIAQAGHTVDSATPSSVQQQAAPQNNVPVGIQLGGTITTPAVSPIVRFTKTSPAFSLSAIPASSFDPNNPSPFPALVDIPTAGVALGNYNVEICFGSHCATSVNPIFSITLSGGGGGPGPGGTGGGEPVPGHIGGIPPGPQTGNDFVALIEGIIDWVFVILILVAIIFIVLAGFQFITGGGDAQQTAQARQKLIWAAVGIAVALLARGIPAAVRNLMGG